MRWLFVRALVLTVALTAVAMPALARPLDHVQYSGSDSFVVEDLCGTDWQVDVTFSGNFMLKAGRHGSPPYLFDNYSYREVWTDLNDPTRVVIHEGNGLWRDHRITLVEGTIYHFEIHETGQPSGWWTADGTLIFRDRGAIVWEFTVDTLGDDDLSNDIFISDEGPTSIHGPHPELLSGEGFCEAINGALDA
jgi:hypothetical protein